MGINHLTTKFFTYTTEILEKFDFWWIAEWLEHFVKKLLFTLHAFPLQILPFSYILHHFKDLLNNKYFLIKLQCSGKILLFCFILFVAHGWIFLFDLNCQHNVPLQNMQPWATNKTERNNKIFIFCKVKWNIRNKQKHKNYPYIFKKISTFAKYVKLMVA